mgnify:FL=1
MRKITSILMLLLFVFSSGVSAQEIKVSTDAEKHWYQIKNFRSGKYAAYGSETEIHQKVNSNYEKGLYWFVVADGAGYRIHNAGTNKIVDGHTWSDGGCVMYIKSNPHKTGYVCISKNSNLESACWDDQSGKIGDWKPTASDADGTSWTFEEVTDAKTIARAELDYWITNVKEGTTPGSYPSTAIAAAKEVADNGEATAGDYTNALATLKNAVSCPVAGKYYVITSAYDRFKFLKGATKSVCVDGQNLKWKTTDLTDKSMFWEIYPEGDKFVFKNYSTGTYISTCAAQSKPYLMGGTPAEQAVFNWYIGADCNINIAGGSLHTEGHNQGNGDNGNIVRYPGGSCTQSAWYIKEVDNVEKEMLQATIAKANILVGVNPGQYPSTDAYSSVLAAAQEMLNNATATKNEYDNQRIALENALAQAQTLTKNDLVAGYYYRIQNTANETYTGIEIANQSAGTSQMKNYTLDENDPRQIWKLEKDGEKYYLVNVASGLYPQNVVMGTDKTASVGAKIPAQNFEWSTHAEASSTSNAQYNIKVGGKQINVEPTGNVNQWDGNNAHHYLWKVDKTDEDILALVNNWVKSQNLTDNAGATPLQVIPGVAQVISPSEFAEPGVVNAAIDKVKEYADAAKPTLLQAQALYNNYTIVNNYVNQAKTYGGILDVKYVLKGQYGTIILPVNYASPQNVKFYTCGAADANGVLTLVETTTGTKKNQPYIVEYTGTDVPTVDNPKKYQIIGYKNGAATTNQTVGWLTGVLGENDHVPSGSYILSKYNGRFAFYKVDGENVKEAQQYRCYLTIPADQPTAVSAFYLNGEGETTGINALLNGNNGETEIYDLSGKRLNHLQKGINIVNGQKVLVK